MGFSACVVSVCELTIQSEARGDSITFALLTPGRSIGWGGLWSRVGREAESWLRARTGRLLKAAMGWDRWDLIQGHGSK